MKFYFSTYLVGATVVVAAVLIACVGSAAAQAVYVVPNANLSPNHDTLIDPNNPTTNYDADRLEVTYSNFPSFVATRRSLLQFDLASVNDSLTEAKLGLTVVETNLLTGGSVNLALYTLADGWSEESVTWDSRPLSGTLLQTITINAEFTGAIQFADPTVGTYLEGERTGDHLASFLLILEGGADPLGFGGNVLFENREGAHDGINGNEPTILLPAGQVGNNQLYLPTILR